MPKDALIMVVDDDQDFRELIQAKLMANGYRCAAAVDGSEAVAKAKEVNPDLILMDVQMPKKDGITAVLDLAADEATKKIPIIFLTSLGDDKMGEINRQFAQQIGARDYFKKSDSYDILIGRIGRLVGAHG